MTPFAETLAYLQGIVDAAAGAAEPDEPRGPARLEVYTERGHIRARASNCSLCVDGYTWSTCEAGYTVSSPCGCGRLLDLARRVNAAKMAADHIRSVLRLVDLPEDKRAQHVEYDPDRSEQGQDALAACYEFVTRVRAFDFCADAFSRSQKPPGLFLCGKAGRGKTHLVTGTCRLLLSYGYRVEYRSWVEWSRQLWGALNARRDAARRDTDCGVTNPDDEIRRAARVPILALDELGAGINAHHGGAAIERGWVESLLKMRHEAGLPVLMASNYHLMDGHDGALQVDETIISRILGRCDVVLMGGEDQRRASNE